MKTKIEFHLAFLRGLIRSLLRMYHIIILIIFLSTNFTFSQEIEPFGLEGMNVNDINFFSGYLFAATDSGVYRRYIGDIDSAWTHIGLEDKKITAIYPHDVGAVSWTVTVGISPAFTPGDSALIYCLNIVNNSWVITDTGIDRNTINRINSIDGFPSPAICGETFAAGGNKLFRRGIDTWYENIFEIEGGVNVVKINLKDNDVWIGGDAGFIQQPFIAYSTNSGDDWTITGPNLFFENTCYDLEFVPSDTNIVYAALRGAVIKSTDGAVSWDSTGLINNSYIFYALAYQPFTNFLFAGGSTGNNEFVLFYSNDGGVNWNQSQSTAYKGISCMIVVPTPIPEIFDLYIGTAGDGVFFVQPLLPSVDDEKNLPKDFKLSQNYPNPFNPTTKIKYTIPSVGTRDRVSVQLIIYDVLGNEIATLVNEELPAGEYEVEFNGHSVEGRNLTSGIYFYQLKADSFIQTKKMVFIK